MDEIWPKRPSGPDECIALINHPAAQRYDVGGAIKHVRRYVFAKWTEEHIQHAVRGGSPIGRIDQQLFAGSDQVGLIGDVRPVYGIKWCAGIHEPGGNAE